MFVRTRGILLAAGASLAVALVAAVGPAVAQTDAWPTRPITIIVPTAAGSGSHLMATLLAESLSPILKQQVVVTPVAGAAGQIGAEQLKRATPDGYTFGVFSNAVAAILPGLKGAALPFDPMRDFVPVVGITSSPDWLAISSKVPANTVQEFIALAKKDPGKLNYGSQGNGSNEHLQMELFMKLTGTELTQVPYPGPLQGIADLVAGNVQAMWVVTSGVAAHVPNGSVKLLAASGTGRMAFAPNVPTMEEQGVKGYVYATWAGMIAPKGVPEPILAKVEAAAREILARPEIVDRMEKGGFAFWNLTAKDFGARIQSDLEMVRGLAKDRNIVLQ